MSTVVPLAREEYDRREEQNFREWTRRNIMNATNLASATSEALRFAILPVYADNAAAGAGGLVQGQFYRTATGQVMVKL
jgi:hypothetical protein